MNIIMYMQYHPSMYPLAKKSQNIVDGSLFFIEGTIGIVLQ